MKGSPFIKPFEDEMNEWEGKLTSMQTIIDNWLKVFLLELVVIFSEYLNTQLNNH
jgi:hypothetical protein